MAFDRRAAYHPRFSAPATQPPFSRRSNLRPAPTQPHDRRITLTWPKAALFLLLGLWPTLLIVVNAGPVLTLAERLRHLNPEHHFDRVAERFRSRAGSALPRLTAVEQAVRQLLAGDHDASAFARMRAADEGNSLYAFLEAGLLARRQTPEDTAARFDTVKDLLNSVRPSDRCDWYVAEAIEAWHAAYEPVGVGPAMTMLWARQAGTREQSLAVRRACDGLLRCGQTLLQLDRSYAALTCAQAVDVLCVSTIRTARAADVALTCADEIGQAQQLIGDIAARTGDWPRRAEAEQRADSATQFADVLRVRMERAPQDPILQIPILRVQPYGTANEYLLSCGFLFAGWITLFGLALTGGMIWLVALVAGRPPGVAPARAGAGLRHWFWCAAILIAPAAGLATAVQWIPPDLSVATSQTWIQSGILLVIILTAAAALTLARSRASAGGTEPGSARVWLLWWAVAAVVALLIFYRPWAPFGTRPDLFERGLRMPLAPSRVSLLYAALAALSLLALPVWLVWVLVGVRRRYRHPDSPGAAAGTDRNFLKNLVVLALWGWLILGIICSGSIRLYHHYDTRLQQLVATDLEDEVSAWMGPAWVRTFFDRTIRPDGLPTPR